jgi:ubiquinone/menaquinone biosynthesis C-methylase UbiE
MRYAKVKKLVPPGSVVCDLGCGFDGAFLQALSSIIKRGYGFDCKVQQVTAGKIILSPINLDNGIPLEDGNVDCVTMLALLEHLDKPASVLQEVFRILRPGGKVILTTPAPCSKPLLEFLAFRLKLISAEEIKDHKHYFSGREIRHLFRKHWFQRCFIKNVSVRFKPACSWH